MALGTNLPARGAPWPDWGSMIHATLTDVAAGGVTQNSDGTWPTITRQVGVKYRWYPTVTPITLPTLANGALPGDDLVGVGVLPTTLT